MKQPIQKLEDRRMQFQDVAPPVLGKGTLLIQNQTPEGEKVY